MSKSVLLPLRDARLVRNHVSLLQKHAESFLKGSDPEAAHNLQTAACRFTELLRCLKAELHPAWRSRLKKLSRQIDKHLQPVRLIETNISVLREFDAKGKVNSIVVELLLNMQKKKMIKARKSAEQFLAGIKLRRYEDFLSHVRGLQSLPCSQTSALRKRAMQLLKIRWNVELDEKKLGVLRMRAQRLEYAMEIEQKRTHLQTGRLLYQVRRLKKLLGRIQDLSVFEKVVTRLRKDWDIRELKLVPPLLEQFAENVSSEKNAQYKRVYLLFGEIVPLLRSPKGKPVRSSYSLVSPTQEIQKINRRSKKLA